MRSWCRPDTTQDSTSSAWRGGARERVDRAFADVGARHPAPARARRRAPPRSRGGRRPGRPRLAARFEHRREVGVAAGPFGLGERAVRDLADQLGLEVELVAVEDEQVALGQPLEQAGRVLAARERERGARSGRCRRRPRSPRAAIVRPARARRAGPRRGRAASRGDPAAGRRPRAAAGRSESWTYATSSSTKNGLPPLRSSRVSTVSSSAQPSNSACTSCAVAARSSGSRWSTNALWRAGFRRPALVEAGPGGREQHERRVAEPAEQAVGELEHGFVGPVEVGERRARAACARSTPRGTRARRGCLRRARGSGRRRAASRLP